MSKSIWVAPYRQNPATLGSTCCRPAVMILPASPSPRALTPQRRRMLLNFASSSSARHLNAAPMANRLFTRTSSIFAKIQPIGPQTRRTKVPKPATRSSHATFGLQVMMISKMKTLPSLGAATESRQRSSRTFSSWVPTSWVAAAPPNSPRATRTLCPERHPCSMSESSPSLRPSPFSWRKKSPPTRT